MRNTDARIYVKNGKGGLEIYLEVSGIPHYLTTRCPNGLLYVWLRGGKTLDELARVKPDRKNTKQKMYHYSRHLRELAEMYIKYDSRFNGGRIDE